MFLPLRKSSDSKTQTRVYFRSRCKASKKEVFKKHGEPLFLAEKL